MMARLPDGHPPIIPVAGRMLSGIGYDAARQILWCTFLNGQWWCYEPIKPETWDLLQRNPIHAFQVHVKPYFRPYNLDDPPSPEKDAWWAAKSEWRKHQRFLKKNNKKKWVPT